MKRMTGILVALVLAVVLPQVVMAAPYYLNWGSQVNVGQCDAVVGAKPLVINVTSQVTNDGDTWFGPGFWALDSFNKHIQVWDLGSGTYCAVVRYQGSFVTTGTPVGPMGSPSAPLLPGVEGSVEGGYRAIITGVLNPNTGKKTKGNIGTFDLGCQSDGTCAPNPFDWLATYFGSGAGFTYEWWGWIYRAGNNGTWVNAISGSYGNITGGP